MCNVNLQKCMSFGKCCPIICRHIFSFFLILIGNSCFQNSSLFNIQLLILRNLFTTIEVYKENCLYPISISIDDLSRLNIMIWEENTIFLRLTISIFFSISLEKNELTKKEFARIYLLIRISILRIRIFLYYNKKIIITILEKILAWSYIEASYKQASIVAGFFPRISV